MDDISEMIRHFFSIFYRKFNIAKQTIVISVFEAIICLGLYSWSTCKECEGIYKLLFRAPKPLTWTIELSSTNLIYSTSVVIAFRNCIAAFFCHYYYLYIEWLNDGDNEMQLNALLSKSDTCHQNCTLLENPLFPFSFPSPHSPFKSNTHI